MREIFTRVLHYEIKTCYRLQYILLFVISFEVNSIDLMQQYGSRLLNYYRKMKKKIKKSNMEIDTLYRRRTSTFDIQNLILIEYERMTAANKNKRNIDTTYTKLNRTIECRRCTVNTFRIKL